MDNRATTDNRTTMDNKTTMEPTTMDNRTTMMDIRRTSIPQGITKTIGMIMIIVVMRINTATGT